MAGGRMSGAGAGGATRCCANNGVFWRCRIQLCPTAPRMRSYGGADNGRNIQRGFGSVLAALFGASKLGSLCQ
eukprot:2014236-Pyramimonas_sp.AAC.1